MKNYFASRCEKTCQTCDQNQYAEASLFNKFLLSLHHFYCRSCRKYSNNNKKLTKLVEDSKMKCMCHSKKKELQRLINTEIQKNR